MSHVISNEAPSKYHLKTQHKNCLKFNSSQIWWSKFAKLGENYSKCKHEDSHASELVNNSWKLNHHQNNTQKLPTLGLYHHNLAKRWWYLKGDGITRNVSYFMSTFTGCNNLISDYYYLLTVFIIWYLIWEAKATRNAVTTR